MDLVRIIEGSPFAAVGGFQDRMSEEVIGSYWRVKSYSSVVAFEDPSRNFHSEGEDAWHLNYNQLLMVTGQIYIWCGWRYIQVLFSVHDHCQIGWVEEEHLAYGVRRIEV